MQRSSCGRMKHLTGATQRQQFRDWLRVHSDLVANIPFPSAVRLYGKAISVSSAYRLAVEEGLRGARRNRTRYEAFWSIIDWRLPDTSLARIWGVARGNLRQRRLRVRAGLPRFCAKAHSDNARYRIAIAKEEERARSYSGPRPR
jgi:hypothetical protein